MIEFLVTNWILFMIIIVLLTSSSCACHHVTRNDRRLIARLTHERFEPARQRRIQLGLEPLFTTRQSQPKVEDEK